MRYRLEDLIGEVCLVDPPCCSVPRIGVSIGWSSIGHSSDLNSQPETSSELYH